MPKTTVQFDSIQHVQAGYDAKNSSFGELVQLSDSDVKRVKKLLKDEITSWEQDTAPLHEKLKHWYDLSEGVIEETDWPYEGAFETHIDVIGIYLKVYHSIENRSILGSEGIWYSEADPDFDFLSDYLPEIDAMLNFKARAEWNIHEMLPEAFSCANRDGLSALKIPFVEDIEHVEDKVFISNEQDFFEEFPDPDQSGLTQQEFDMLHQVALTATEESPLEIPIEYDRQVYSGPKAYLVERVNFVTFPATARSLEREVCRGFGDRFFIRREEVRRKMEAGEWYEDACKDFLKRTYKRGSGEADDYTINKETIVGLARSDKSDDYEFFELTYWLRLKNKSEVKHVLIYCKEFNLLMMAKKFFYRVDYYASFRIDRRPNQLDGRSIPGQLEFINEAIDVGVNQRFQSREITNIPSFKGKAKRTTDKEFDLEADENQWRPGVVFWLEDPDLFAQFQVQPVDHSGSLAEESNMLRYASFIMGVDIALSSGHAPTEDPNAPGNKTAMLIDMGNLRMEDPLSELRHGVEQVGMICLSHLYQFGPPVIAYNATEGQKMVTKYLKKRILRTGIKIKMMGITVVMNSDTEFQKWVQRAQVLIQSEPMIANNAQRRTELWRRALKNGRVQNADRILPSVEEAKQQDIETQKQAILQLQQEQAMKDQQAKAAIIQQGAEKKKALIGALKQKIQMKKLAKGLSGAPSNGVEPAVPALPPTATPGGPANGSL